ncbi:MAG: hypothetical protein AAGC77_10580, partial [Pseudomonadota bacterium]
KIETTMPAQVGRPSGGYMFRDLSVSACVSDIDHDIPVSVAIAGGSGAIVGGSGAIIGGSGAISGGSGA